MANKIRLVLQTPTIEATIKAKNSVGQTDSFIVGFVRHDAEDARNLSEQLQALEGDGPKLALIRENISYIKNIKVPIVDDETGKKVDTLSIADTRTVKPNDYWENSEECLNILWNAIIASNAYRLEVFNWFYKTLLDIHIEGDLGN